MQVRYEKRCALINKEGVFCAELNDFLQDTLDSESKLRATGLSQTKDAETNLDIRFALINQINPLNSNAAELENTILQILRSNR